MKLVEIVAVVAILLTSMAAQARVDCTLDQKAVTAELLHRASKNLGFMKIRGKPTVQWRERSGKTIRISYRGCADLGAEVRVSLQRKSLSRLTNKDLVAAVARYWSLQQAEALASALKSNQPASHVEHGVTIIEAQGDDGAFPQGFTVELKPTVISLTWQDL